MILHTAIMSCCPLCCMLDSSSYIEILPKDWWRRIDPDQGRAENLKRGLDIAQVNKNGTCSGAILDVG